jgi:hypothetical protein
LDAADKRKNGRRRINKVRARALGCVVGENILFVSIAQQPIH